MDMSLIMQHMLVTEVYENPFGHDEPQYADIW